MKGKEMEIKLIALDLDGTLLDSQKKLSDRNRAVLEECVRRGIYVVPCTGRIWGGVPEFIREFPGIRYAITTNGAVVEDVQEHKIIDERKLTCKQALEILELAHQFHTMYDAYVDGQAFAEERFMRDLDSFGIPATLQGMIRATRQIVPDVAEKVRQLNLPAEKLNYFFGDSEERLRAKKALEARGDVVISSSFRLNLEINALGATKGNAIWRLADYLGLKPEQTMGFGDGGNDLTMMKMAGVGVAMGNAEEEIKEASNYVTASNDEDGVAWTIEKLVLKK
ncbi:Cof-type HAD-IIB family hydrolase [Brotaphodocola sp.]|uniref:Cof-type HAD-IIB family hydrolase n=1 Tax=Brotaphodocola sp. TaxID=3073577 RepID=UPI003D7E167A